MNPYATGADESPFDIRTFAFAPSGARRKGGTRYRPQDIEDQKKVGICTSIALTQNAAKALGKKFSADFQYLCQKKYYDINWREGSSLFHALKSAKNIGLLPDKEFRKWVKEDDRKLPYHAYIAKLQAVPEDEIERLKKKAAENKIKAYAKVPVDRDLMALAIDESRAGILARYALGKEWWTKPIEPLRPPVQFISGHAVTDSNYDGQSFRLANSWGTDWADLGTAYRLQSQYAPTEAWMVYYNDVPKEVSSMLDERTALYGKILDIVQKTLELLRAIKKIP